MSKVPKTNSEKDTRFRIEFNGTFMFKGLEFTGKAGAYSITDSEKGLYLQLKPGEKGLGLGKLVNNLIDDSNTKFDEESIPSSIDKENKDLQSIPSFYIKYLSSETEGSEFDVGIETKFKINNEALDFTLIYQYRKTKEDATSHSFSGILKWKKHRFRISFSKGDNGASFLASYIHEGNTQINLSEIANALFKLKVQNFSLGLENPTAFFLFNKKGDKNSFLFGIGASMKFENMAELPLIGPVIKDKPFGIDELLIIVAKGFEDIKGQSIKDLDPKLFGTIEFPDKVQPFNLSMKVIVGDQVYPFSTSEKTAKELEGSNTVAQPPEESTDQIVTPPVEAKVTSLPGTVSSEAKWINVKKKLGPVSLDRIGLGLINKKIVILLDASFALAGLGVQLKGMGLGFEPKWPPKVTEFYLDGLGISFKKDPIEVSAAFMRGTEMVQGELQTVYTGAAVLKLSKFTISGLGSYAKVNVTTYAKDENGLDIKSQIISTKPYTSLFIYAVYDGPIGGPAFFFVTGIAAGFGMNRKVNVPAIDEVGDFPLVSLAMNSSRKPQKTLMEILTDLQTPQKSGKLPIEISYGDYWLAVGIKFSSFKIIDSFILLIVSFGNRLRFDILGLSVLAVPPKIGDAIEPLVYVELALKVSFGSDSDVVSVEAMITANSYLFSKDCKLRGGFALYIWVSGKHEGDFVVTLGGYHPSFKKPAHYPNVDRLSLIWKFPGDILTIKGEMYFALTPAAIMAGGRWEVTCDLGYVRAYVIIWADVLIQWAPLYYELNAGVLVGVEVNVKIGGLRIHFKLEIGAQLRIWGPPFAGEIVVHLWIFSFTIPFGDHSKPLPPPLTWLEFHKSFLPPENQKIDTESKALLKTKPVTIVISDGIIEEHKSETGEVDYMVVNPHKLKLTIDSAIPVAAIKVTNGNKPENLVNDETPLKIAGNSNDGTEITSETVVTYVGRNQELGIRPMKVEKLNSILNVSIKVGDNGTEEMELCCIGKSVPEALWSPNFPTNKTISLDDINKSKDESAVIQNVISGIEFKPKQEQTPAGTREFNLEGKYNLVRGKDLEWTYQPVLLGTSNESLRFSIKKTIENSLEDEEVMNKRAKLFEAAASIAGLKEGESDIDLKAYSLQKDWVDSLMGEPVIVSIGGMPQYRKEKGKPIK